jgi:hypothetical protein
LRTSQGYIFFILQHLATNLCSFTHSKTLFLAASFGFRSSCLDQNLVCSRNHPLLIQERTVFETYFVCLHLSAPTETAPKGLVHVTKNRAKPARGRRPPTRAPGGQQNSVAAAGPEIVVDNFDAGIDSFFNKPVVRPQSAAYVLYFVFLF